MRNGKEAKARRKDVVCDPLRNGIDDPNGMQSGKTEYFDGVPDSLSLFPGESPYFPLSVASACECTGMAVTLPQTEEEAASLRDIYAAPIVESAPESRRNEKNDRDGRPENPHEKNKREGKRTK